MATTSDFTYGHHISNEVLDALHATFPNGHMDDGDPASLVAAAFQLDKQLGLTQEGDKLIMDPSLGMWFLLGVRVVSPPQLIDLHKKMINVLDSEESDEEEDDATSAEMERLLTNWFEVCFDGVDPETKETYWCHPILKGRNISVRFLTGEERVDAGFFCATVRTDGSLIVTDPAARRTFK